MSAKPWIPSRRELPGIILALLLGVVAYAIGAAVKPHTEYVSSVVVAIILGALVLNTPLAKMFRLGAPTDRDADAYERGLRFTGKWVLRLAIILMGLKIQTDLFRADQLLMVLLTLVFALPTGFFLTHVAARRLGLRQELGDLLAMGTMVCGASAINALSPVLNARRRDQGLAITAVFLFSVVALMAFYPVGQALGLSEEYGGLWAGLAVGDLSSSVAVGSQFSDSASVIAAAAKSVRIMLLGPLLIMFMMLRPAARGSSPDEPKPTLWSHFPRFILGYFLFFGLRLLGDHSFGASSGWIAVLEINDVVVKLLILAVCAGIGLQIHVRTLIELGWKAVLAGGAASLGVAGLSLAMLYAFAHDLTLVACACGAAGLAFSYGLYRLRVSGDAAMRPLLGRFADGAPLSIREVTALLDYHDARGGLDDELRRRVLRQLYPAIGELQPLRTTELVAPINYRRLVYWLSKRGSGSLVGILWAPGAEAHIHSHGYDGIGKIIEGRVEDTQFSRLDGGRLKVSGFEVVDPGAVVSFTKLETVHAVRNPASKDAIHLHIYGPPGETPGERFDPVEPWQLHGATVGDVLRVTASDDVLPQRHVEAGALTP